MSEERTAADLPLPGGNFLLMIQRMGYQGLLGLGVLENPVTGTKQVNLPTAKMVLEDLRMLTEKTTGNLADDEKEHLEGVVRDLEGAYAKASEATIDDATS
tara:strand:- start:40 stop:342 length:303 start_codon:yes stop_codon:yes gene_type:complete